VAGGWSHALRRTDCRRSGAVDRAAGRCPGSGVRRRSAGPGTASAPTRRPAGSRDGWSIRNTAEAQKLSLGKTHSLLLVGKAIKKNPTISHASTFAAAVKLAKAEQ